MRRRTLLILCLSALALLTGCSRNTAEKYVGEQITSIKEKGCDSFTKLLDEGIAESNETFVLQFPEELREPYQDFMKESFARITFEVSKAQKMNDGTYSVQVTYTPLNIKKSLTDTNTELVTGLETTEPADAVASILEKDADILKDSPSYDTETISTIDVSKDGEKFTVKQESLDKFIAQAIPGYMEPYNAVCDILDSYDFIKAYLDASFKGDVARFAIHTGRTEEEALAWYEADVFTPPSDLSEAYIPRYQEALKTIMKQCQYTVGIPKKEEGIYSYTVDITTTPNKSFADAYHEFENGTYYSIEEVSAGLIQAMEKYAAAPTFGEETTVTVPVNVSSLLNAGMTDSELSNLATTILVMP